MPSSPTASAPYLTRIDGVNGAIGPLTPSMLRMCRRQRLLQRRVYLDAKRLAVLDVPDLDDPLAGLDAGRPPARAEGRGDDDPLPDLDEVIGLEGHLVHGLVERLEVAAEAVGAAVRVGFGREVRRRGELELGMNQRQEGLDVPVPQRLEALAHEVRVGLRHP